MKNMFVKSAVLAVASIGMLAGSALATPVYTGDTYAAWGEGGLPSLPTATGYYIWSNDEAKTSWSVRWTGNNDGGTPVWVSWKGSVEFVGNDMTSLTAIAWDNHDGATPTYTNLSPLGLDFEAISYDALAGYHWDGFDFTIDPSADAGRLRFNLGGGYYSSLTLNDSDDGVAAYAMWIGDGNVMNVNVATTTMSSDNYIFQSFETPAPVPEPATMLLFGTGLASLAGAARRKKKE